jgi:hypothetical protein
MKGQKRLLGVNFFTLSEFETSMQRWMVICRFFFEHFLRSDGSLASLKWLAAFYALTDNLKRQQTLDRFFSQVGIYVSSLHEWERWHRRSSKQHLYEAKLFKLCLTVESQKAVF